jgi:hypothetical protein
MCVSAIDFASVYKIFRLDLGTVLTVWYFCFLLYCIGQHEWTVGIAQCGFLGSITKVIAIEERTKDWWNRECQNIYSRTVKLKVKCLKSLEKEPKSSLSKNYKRIQQDQVIRKGKNISMYPPCVLVYAKSVGNWMRLGHMHIQLYNETFIVHANTSTSIKQLKYMTIHSWF